MSAIEMTCDKCGEAFITGVVGSWSWPPHECTHEGPEWLPGLPKPYPPKSWPPTSA